MVKVKPQINSIIVVPNVYALSKQNIYQLINQRFGSCLDYQNKINFKKSNHEGHSK